MARTNIDDLTAFVAIARNESFTGAAGKLGVTPSALSYTMRNLEERLGVRLLMRTTRNVRPTEAGERLLTSIGPMLDQIEAEVAALGELRSKPAGTIRITADELAVATIVGPALYRFLPQDPDVSVEVVIDYGLTDIVAERFDAGVRLGGIVAKDMIAVPIGPPMEAAIVASPAYFESNPKPLTPDALTAHRCLNIRLPTLGGIYAWEFEKDSKATRVRVEGPLVFNSYKPIVEAAVSGVGIAYAMLEAVHEHLQAGTLVRVLEDWTQPFDGYHIYYANRRQPTPAFTALLDALRYPQKRRS
jgi:DNA-binding transcriptional LysR family regulator